MPDPVTPTEAGACLGCGGLVDADAAFCPSCGMQRVPDLPTPTTDRAGEADRLKRSTHKWLLVALVAVGVVLLVAGLLVGRILAGGDGDDVVGEGDGGAAVAMDAYAPIAEAWADKHAHLDEEAGEGDANGLATSAEDARLWIEVNRPDLVTLTGQAGGGSASWFEQIVAVYDERAVVLADIESIATAGGEGSAVAGEMAELATLDEDAAWVTCEIADVIRAEGDDPDDHITPEMNVAC